MTKDLVKSFVEANVLFLLDDRYIVTAGRGVRARIMIRSMPLLEIRDVVRNATLSSRAVNDLQYQGKNYLNNAARRGAYNSGRRAVPINISRR